MGVQGKIILITGAGSGIGADVARHLSKLGAKISMVDQNPNGLHEVACQIENTASSSLLTIVADVTKDTERIVNETINHFGKLDVLINNAGIARSDQMQSVDMNQFDQVFDVNVRSAVALTKLCVPHLEKTKGNIVNVSSIVGMKAMRGVFSYGISKAALNQFTKCCALDLAPEGIRVNAINPGSVRTPIHRSYGLTLEQAEKFMEMGKQMTALGRLGEVSDTSAAIAYLADDELAAFLTGVLLPVDGGTLIA